VLTTEFPALGTVLPLVMPAGLYDDWLGSKFGDFQELNRSDKKVTVCIDLSSCEFASPLPVLAVIAELMTHSEPNRQIVVELGSRFDGQRSNNRERTRKYLATHGFLDAFLSRKDLHIWFHYRTERADEHVVEWYSSRSVSGPTIDELRASLERLPVNLLYGAAIALPATVWLLPHGERSAVSAVVRDKVDSLLRFADQALFKFKTEARKFRDTTLHRLTQVLLELVENVAEHAYLGAPQGYVGLYVRVRLPESEKSSKWRQDELSRSHLLREVLRSGDSHQIEIFVLDVGRGLVADVAAWEGCAKISKSKHILQSLMGTLFFKPVSRHSRESSEVAARRGRSTGLVHLNEILQREHDVSRIAVMREWVAGTHPRDPNFQAQAAERVNTIETTLGASSV